ncbi:hypothetical protein [Amycolatopsis taiwanensis]|uniref:Uncharacterized protein n=1 Tax=Amycolatopsis taiwanensis TaxID=342230 RepID=A0A9W6VFF9_9PSEU|nr:hypothetical protein [Amycolatopsis taiwanensis]GLY66755.1 hypothetical protein Atai01_33740 [Amycolatopsis taiwanensis]
MTDPTVSRNPSVHRTLRQLNLALRFLCAAGLVTDAIVHFVLARDYDRISGVLTEGTVFRIESTVALLVAFGVLATSHRIVAAAAFLVAATAVAAVIVNVYVELGPIGPLPDMYEPIWFPEKSIAAIAEGVAAAAAAALLIRPIARATRRGRRSQEDRTAVRSS